MVPLLTNEQTHLTHTKRTDVCIAMSRSFGTENSLLTFAVQQASFELRSAASRQTSEVVVKGYKTKENSNYSPEP